MATAASYALDLIDIPNVGEINLDLSTGRDEGIQQTLVLTHKYNVSRKKNVKKSKGEREEGWLIPLVLDLQRAQ